MPKEVTPGVSKVPDSPGKFRVFWKQSGKANDDMAYYTNDLYDAGVTLAAISRRASKGGYTVHISKAQMTQKALRESAGYSSFNMNEQDESHVDEMLDNRLKSITGSQYPTYEPNDALVNRLLKNPFSTYT